MKLQISTGFHGAELRDIGIDPAKYAARLKEEILKLFPEAEVQVPYDENASGVLPWRLKTHALISDSDLSGDEIVRQEEQAEATVKEIDIPLDDPTLHLTGAK
jgi:hypothetical protein